MAADNVERLFLRCEGDSTAYARLQGLIWAANGLAYPELLQERCVAAIAETVRSCSATHFVLNCEGVTDMDDHAFDQLLKGDHMMGKTLRLTNANHLQSRLAPYLDAKNGLQALKFRLNDIALGENVPEVVIEPKQIEGAHLEHIIQECAIQVEDKGGRKLHSTLLRSNFEYDAKRIIARPERFTWVTLALKDELHALLADLRPTGRQVKLLSVSLRGNPFAAALGLLKGLEVVTIDHLGPKHRVFELDMNADKDWGVDFIYVGDFTVGGTELKTASVYCSLLGARLTAGVVIASALPPSEYVIGNQSAPLRALRVLTESNSDLKYWFHAHA